MKQFRAMLSGLTSSLSLRRLCWNSRRGRLRHRRLAANNLAGLRPRRRATAQGKNLWQHVPGTPAACPRRRSAGGQSPSLLTPTR